MKFRLALDVPAPRRHTRSAVVSGIPSRWHPLERRALRQSADRILRGGARVHPESVLLVWRATELTSTRERRACARSLRGTLKELDGNALRSAVPVNRRGVRPYASDLATLANRIGDLSRPVSARGMLLVQDLLTNGDSPLYARRNIDRLPRVLQTIQAALGVGV